jgi:ribosomal protein L11
MEAKKMWNNIPYVDETITYAAGNYNVANDKDAWVGINADLDAAVRTIAGSARSMGVNVEGV